MQSGLWNAKCPACCCFGIKFCEESSNVIQGMLHAQVWTLTQFPQTPSLVQSSQESVSAGAIIDH